MSAFHLRKKRTDDGDYVIVDKQGVRVGFQGDFGPWDLETVKVNIEYARRYDSWVEPYKGTTK